MAVAAGGPAGGPACFVSVVLLERKQRLSSVARQCLGLFVVTRSMVWESQEMTQHFPSLPLTPSSSCPPPPPPQLARPPGRALMSLVCFFTPYLWDDGFFRPPVTAGATAGTSFFPPSSAVLSLSFTLLLFFLFDVYMNVHFHDFIFSVFLLFVPHYSCCQRLFKTCCLN